MNAAVHSEHDILIRCEIEAKPVESSELECLMWRMSYTFKIECKIKRLL
jgi:hypothetical protein